MTRSAFMMTRCLLASAVLWALCTSSAVLAACQSVPAQPPSQENSFSALFPNQSNNNGFEEFVRAADIIQNVADIDAAVEPQATLALKRQVLVRAECARALALIREGLGKPVTSPRLDPDSKSRLPLVPFLKLGKLLQIELYVNCADGRVSAAIEALRTGLAFGYLIQSTTLVSGMVGVTNDAVLLTETAAHLEQLSVYDCDSILRLVRGLLASDCPGIQLLNAEKLYLVAHLDSLRATPFAVAEFTDNNGVQVSAGAVIDEAEAHIVSVFDAAVQNMRLPVPKRFPIPDENSNSPGWKLYRVVAIDPQRVIDKYGADQARIRLLGVHVLIMRFRWDHNRLPTSLTELHEDSLTIDPFTGSQLLYKRENAKYTLTSAGPFQIDPTTKRPNSQREPVSLH